MEAERGRRLGRACVFVRFVVDDLAMGVVCSQLWVYGDIVESLALGIYNLSAALPHPASPLPLC